MFEAASPYFVINFASSFVFASSCSRRLSFSFTACREMLPDPAFYARCLEQSYDELKEAALKPEKSPAPEKKTTAKKAARKKAARKKAATPKAAKKTVRKSAVKKSAEKKRAKVVG